MAKPSINEAPGIYTLEWAEDSIKVVTSKVRQHRDGKVTGEIWITTTATNSHSHLHQAQFNFSSTQARTSLAKVMAGKYSNANWGNVLEQLCFYVLAWVRQGEPVLELSADGDFKPPEYLLYPVLLKDEPTIIFGEGESAKSLIGLLFSIIIGLPWVDNPFKLQTLNAPSKILYLDWETSKAEIGWRLKCFREGLDLPNLSINYRRCALPLADDMEQIHEMIQKTNSNFLIVDSIAAASGGDVNSAEVALRFFSALRQLKITSLLIAHTAKNADGKARTVYGSAFYFNSARSVWLVKRVSETDETEINVGLFHKKHNNSQGFKPIGFKMMFNEHKTTVELQDVKQVGEFLQETSLPTRITELLKNGAAPAGEIAEALEAGKESTRSTLNRMKQRSQVIKIGNNWGLPYND